MKANIKKTRESSITPLFWQHGESKEVLSEEIQKMHEVGIGSFIVEARPFPQYLEKEWWETLKHIVEEAKKRQMRVYLFDDGDYPSGSAMGRIREKYPQHMKKYMKTEFIDVTGQWKDAMFAIESFIWKDETLLRVVAAKRIDRNDAIETQTLIDLTHFVEEGTLFWDVPEGDWRIFIIKQTLVGGEDHTKNHIDPLNPLATQAFIEEVYEPTYELLKDDFGDTFAGFFSDEPRLGNEATYDLKLGRYSNSVTLPYSSDLFEALSKKGNKDDVEKYLPLLWFDGFTNVGGEWIASTETADMRYLYMDYVSWSFGKNFIGQIGDWCRAHGVKLIGHVVEENGTHARLGYGAGHFFRALDGMDVGGLDIVCNIFPEQLSGRYKTMFNYYECDFNHWGLAKLASSAAHLDEKKHGETVCELFGAYGWFEGLKLMKWITDEVVVRGVNHLIPHSFSPKEFPDQDCPPHFYARGKNPQYRVFDTWATYANNICGLLSGGMHKAPVAVLYHAEAEWSYECMPFEKVVKELAKKQIDSDVVPSDIIEDCKRSYVHEKKLVVTGKEGCKLEEFSAIIVTASKYVSRETLERLGKFADSGLKVIFVDEVPNVYLNETAKNEVISDNFVVCSLEEVAKETESFAEINVEGEQGEQSKQSEQDELIYYHYVNNTEVLNVVGNHKPDTESNKGSKPLDAFFFVNQSTQKDGRYRIEIKANELSSWDKGCSLEKRAFIFDAMTGDFFPLSASISQGETPDRLGAERLEEVITFDLELMAWESIFVIFLPEDIWDEQALSEQEHNLRPLYSDFSKENGCTTIEIDKPLALSIATSQEYPRFKTDAKCAEAVEKGFVNLALPKYLPNFSGTFRYEMSFEIDNDTYERAVKGQICIDLGRVFEVADIFVNGTHLATKICPPYCSVVDGEVLKRGKNTLVVEVINTLVKEAGITMFDKYFVQEPSGLLGPVNIIIR